jgi:hypothetical protein
MSFVFKSTELNATNIINRIGHFNTKAYKFKVGKSYEMCDYANMRKGVLREMVTCIKRTRCFVTFRNDRNVITSKLFRKKIKKEKNTDFLDKEICKWTGERQRVWEADAIPSRWDGQPYMCWGDLRISALN